MKSPWQQYTHQPDGSITLEGRPDIAIEVIEEQGLVTARHIEAELGLPKYFEQWEELAKPRGLSGRQIQFIVMDQSETRFPDRYRFKPQRIALPSTCHLEFGHRGFLIGIVHTFILGSTRCARRFPPCSASSYRITWRATTSSVKPHCLTRRWLKEPGTRPVSESFCTCVR